MNFNNWRIDPFSGTTFKEALEEVYQIGEIAATPGVYGIILDETPWFSGAIGAITIVEVANAAGDPLSGGTVYTEVVFSVSPIADEYRVDYNDDGSGVFFSTGRVNFNASEDAKFVKVNYDGLGTTVKDRYQLNQVSVVPTNLGVEGAVEITDGLEVGTGTTGGGIIVADGLAVGAGAIVVSDPTGDTGVGNQLFNDRRFINDGLINDPQFNLGLWRSFVTVSEPGIVDDTANDGVLTTMKLFATGSYTRVGYTPEPGELYTPNNAETIWVTVRLRKDAGWDGDLRIRCATFDQDKVGTGTPEVIILPAALTTSYVSFTFPLRLFAFASGGATYINFRLYHAATGSTGAVYCSFIQFSRSPKGSAKSLRDWFKDSVGSNIIMVRQDCTAMLFGGYVPINYISGVIAITGSWANYDIDYTDSLPNQVKAVVCQVTAIGTSTTASIEYRDKSGNAVISVEAAIGGASSVQAIAVAIIPIYSYGGASGKARLRLRRTIGVSGLVTPVGFIF